MTGKDLETAYNFANQQVEDLKEANSELAKMVDASLDIHAELRQIAMEDSVPNDVRNKLLAVLDGRRSPCIKMRSNRRNVA